MIKKLLIGLVSIAFLIGVLLPASAQKAKPVDDLRTMVETERAFSRTAGEKGTREAFTAFIADDGVLFRPHAVNGKQWFQEHPVPTSTAHPLLAWQPIYAFVSGSGDLGYTTGPWQYKNDIKDAKASAFGDFMTIWKKQPDGNWRFVLDLGISNPEPKTNAQASFPAGVTGRFASIDTHAARMNLLQEEMAFSKASENTGAAEAFLSKADADVRVFRENEMPFVGRAAAAKAMYPPSSVWTWSPAFADVSAAGDLAYSYGIYRLRDKKTDELTERGNYARVWKKVAGTWRVVIDVANPVKD